MKSLIVASFVCAAIVFSGTLHLSAQEQPNKGRPGDPRQFVPDKQTRELFYSNLVKYLKLSEPVSRKFKPIFEEYGATRGRLLKENVDIVHEIIEKADNESVPINDLKTLAQRYKATNRAIWQEREKFLRRASEILDERQMVRLTIYEDKMKDDLFKKFRDRRGDGPPKGESGPPNPR